ncbi:hypothetical protein GJ496_001960 [Pomphorhynchus laevis]|nr:hypothetical protein GJ496_001960 [Pomphorhynchus laevis]
MAAVCAYSIVKYGLFGYINELEKDGRWDAVEAPNPSVSLTRREFTFDAALKITTDNLINTFHNAGNWTGILRVLSHMGIERLRHTRDFLDAFPN